MSQANHTHSVTSAGLYIGIFLALMVLTILTVAAAWVDMGLLNTPIALLIAGTKATLVVLFFMEVRHAHPITKLAVISAILWLVILGVLTFSDYISRGWLYRPQNW
ncbi:MAG: cytochrome C oxidase subunit IV family protein [Bryobacterales bacterium]|nr:cytochrome C oxidase subunit IV family protein [Bryobacterales bacterium]